jgi:hypothetical protein
LDLAKVNDASFYSRTGSGVNHAENSQALEPITGIPLFPRTARQCAKTTDRSLRQFGSDHS